ncbi:hypothetical protein GOALK_022_00220 [Gordonia alkanivorans NBRC 16433]|uniref:Uncharacterized protein n=1 Tax=Gordonia alkanivorans NBRC 16433 TaxID=1027371 RepID=F9VRB8_9ACTN|nr:hypothetical protein GOALK_022_00220 [Gordonia alkanivorans NBRC 16433]
MGGILGAERGTRDLAGRVHDDDLECFGPVTRSDQASQVEHDQGTGGARADHDHAHQPTPAPTARDKTDPLRGRGRFSSTGTSYSRPADPS